VTAKLLFVCKKERLDIHVLVAFLATRVKDSDEGNWKKLSRGLKYLNGTRDMVLTLEVDDLSLLKWYVDFKRFTEI